MARLDNALTPAGQGFAGDQEVPMVNLAAGGQQGAAPAPEAIYSNTNYVKQNLMAFLVAEPLGYADLPDPALWTAGLKALIEVQATSITGLNSTLTVDMEGRPVGGAGEQHEDVTNVTRAVSEPAFTWPEKYGKAVTRFWDGHIVNLLGDPDTKVPRVTTFTDKQLDLLSDYNGFSVLFVEPDPTFTKVVEAWLSVNMRPRTGVTNEGRREIAGAGELLDAAISFSSVTTCGAAVLKEAQKRLDELNRKGFNANNNTLLPETGATANVAAGEDGFAERLDKIAGAAK